MTETKTHGIPITQGGGAAPNKAAPTKADREIAKKKLRDDSAQDIYFANAKVQNAVAAEEKQLAKDLKAEALKIAKAKHAGMVNPEEAVKVAVESATKPLESDLEQLRARLQSLEDALVAERGKADAAVSENETLKATLKDLKVKLKAAGKPAK